METTNNLIKGENKDNSLNPIIYTEGLNQLYFIDYNFLTYSSLEKEIKYIIQQKNNFLNFSEILSTALDNYNKNIILNYSEFKDFLFKKINSNINALLQNLDEWILNNVNYLHKKQLSFMKSININIYNENLFYLLIDEICLMKYFKENNISFNFYTQKELLSGDIMKNLISIDKKIFLYSYNPATLILFKKYFSKNIFTFLLNTYLFCFKDLIIDSEEYKLQNKIIKYFEEEKEKKNIYNNSPYIINSDINFITLNIFSINFLYYEIINKNITSYELLIKYFSEKCPKIVLIFTRFLTRKQNFVKQRYFISDEDIIYKPH